MLKGILILATLIYPLLVYLGLSYWEPRYLALVVGALFALRFIALRQKKSSSDLRHCDSTNIWQIDEFPLVKKIVLLFALLFAAFFILELVFNYGLYFLFIPALINGALLFIFTLTLLYPPSLAERVARLTTKEITAEHVNYCRSVTLLWCAFFVLNILLSLYTAFFSSVEIWTFYNGLLVYILMGAVFLGEATYRYWRFRVYVGSVLDPFFRPIFPPHKEDHKGAGDE